MNEEFILSEKWYLEITEENKEFIQNWRKLVFGLDNNIDNWYCVNNEGERMGAKEWCGREDRIETSEFITHVYNPLFNIQSSIEEDYTYLIPFIQNLNLNVL